MTCNTNAGTRSNKYIEIYNPSTAPVNLADYMLAKVWSEPATSDSARTPTQTVSQFKANSVVAAGDVFVICGYETNKKTKKNLYETPRTDPILIRLRGRGVPSPSPHLRFVLFASSVSSYSGVYLHLFML